MSEQTKSTAQFVRWWLLLMLHVLLLVANVSSCICLADLQDLNALPAMLKVMMGRIEGGLNNPRKEKKSK